MRPRRRREIPLASHDAAALADPAGGLDAAVLAALRRLPTRQREVIALRVFLDLDTQATAQVLGIAPGTVIAHLSCAATALRREPALRSLAAPSRANTTHDGVSRHATPSPGPGWKPRWRPSWPPGNTGVTAGGWRS